MERKRETIDVLNIPNFADSVCKIDLVTLSLCRNVEDRRGNDLYPDAL